MNLSFLKNICRKNKKYNADKNRYVDGYLICLKPAGCQDLVYYTPQSYRKTFLAECNVCILIDCIKLKTSRKWQTKDSFIFSYPIVSPCYVQINIQIFCENSYLMYGY